MQITASMVKDLREQTGAGMMDAKKALQENNGDFDAATDWLRKKGMAKAAKKASRTAAEGIVWAVSEGTKGAVVEVNAETDFVAKNEEFSTFVKGLASLAVDTGSGDVETLKATPMAGSSVGEKLTDLVAKIGENMEFRRAGYLEVSNGTVAAYNHMNGKIGVLVAIEGTDSAELQEVAKQVAMHVAAQNPQFLDRDAVDSDALDRERAIFMEQAKSSGKPDNIVEKIVGGRVNKYYEEVCLTDQAFIMDTDRKVKDVLAGVDAQAKITGYVRLALGEGVEKEEGDFAAEVAAAVNG